MKLTKKVENVKKCYFRHLNEKFFNGKKLNIIEVYFRKKLSLYFLSIEIDEIMRKYI